jgi:hypothetical protein
MDLTVSLDGPAGDAIADIEQALLDAGANHDQAAAISGVIGQSFDEYAEDEYLKVDVICGENSLQISATSYLPTVRQAPPGTPEGSLVPVEEGQREESLKPSVDPRAR